MVIQGTHPLFKRKQKLFILFTCNLEKLNSHFSNKHETGLVICRVGIHKMFIRIVNREDPDQTVLLNI